MKIAHIVSTYPPYRGGMGHVAEAYVEGLRLRGHEVDVYCPAYAGTNTSQDPVYIHRLRPMFQVGNAALMPRMPELSGRYDVLHLHYPFFGGMEQLLVKLLVNAQKQPPLVVTYHMDPVAHGFKEAVFRLHERVYLPHLLRVAKKVLVSSFDYAEASALARFSWAKQKWGEHPFGVDGERFFPHHQELWRKEHHISPDACLLVFVGGMDTPHAFKGVPVLIRALAKSPTACEAVLVGDGDLRASFETLAASLGVAHRVHFLGNVSPEALPEVYAHADIHVLPSTESAEAFGLVTLEAAASGLPSVVSDLPGVRSLVLPGETGYVIEPANEQALAEVCTRLLMSPDKRRALGRAARKRVKKEFTWAYQLDRLEAVYEEVHLTHEA